MRANHRDADTVAITHEDLAHRLDASRENVSRALKRLKEGGVLARRRGRLDILDLGTAGRA